MKEIKEIKDVAKFIKAQLEFESVYTNTVFTAIFGIKEHLELIAKYDLINSYEKILNAVLLLKDLIENQIKTLDENINKLNK